MARLTTDAKFGALRIEERLTLARSRSWPSEVLERGRARLSVWKSSPGLSRPGAFDLWLTSFSCSEDELATGLGLEDLGLDVGGEVSLPTSVLDKWLFHFPEGSGPVWERLRSERLKLHLEAGREFFARLSNDYVSLCERFGDLGELVSIEGDAGDSHAGARRVCILKFASGRKIVYKPRSLAADVGVARAVEWMNPSLKFGLRIFDVIDRGTYGWCEFIEHSPATSLEAFYWRAGAWLAFFYFISGRDLHSENLIACGDHPIPIDLEMIFCPRTSVQLSSGSSTVENYLLESCLSTGLLPSPRVSGDRIYDGSGLGVGGSLSHRPFTDIDAALYTSSIEDGFRSVYSLFLREKPFDLLESFANVNVRMILRPTATYAGLLDDSFHPELLQDDRERELYLAQLWWETPARPDLQKLVMQERAQLLQGDIPYFSALACETNDVLVKSGLDVARERLESASAVDLERQLWILRASMGLLQSKVNFAWEDRETPLDTANEIADWIERTAIDDSWATVDFTRNPYNKDTFLKVQPIDLELYNGLTGIAWLMHHLGRSAVAARLWTLLAERPQLPSSVGAFGGLGGFFYLSAHMGRRVPARYIEAMRDRIAHDRTFDIVGGSAGAVLALLAYGARELKPGARDHGPVARELASLAANHLLKNAHADSLLLDLPMPRGFSHGHTGIALAFHRLGKPEIARKILASEDALLREKWTDIGHDQISWCHGPAGLALGRLSMGLGADSWLAALANPWPANQSLCHGELGNLEALEKAGPRWRAMFEKRRDEIWARGRFSTAVAKGVATPGLMTGTAGIAYALLRMHDPAKPSILTLDPPL